MIKNVVLCHEAQRLMSELVAMINERMDAANGDPEFIPSPRMIERMNYYIKAAGDYEDEHLHEPGTSLITRLQLVIEVQRGYDRHEYKITWEQVNSAVTQALTEYAAVAKQHTFQ